MDKIGKKLTDRELIDFLLAWYRLDQSTEELREAVAAYVRQNSAEQIAVSSSSVSFEESKPSVVKTFEPYDSGLDFEGVVPKQSTYKAQFEPTDELIGTRGWSIDAWALYYGIEEFFQKISFGLLNMQALAILFCIGISAAVMVGAWQSILSTERQKKAAYKSIPLEPAGKESIDPQLSELRTHNENSNLEVGNVEGSNSVPLSEPVSEPNTMVASTSVTPELGLGPEVEFIPTLQMMENADWNSALENLQSLQETGKRDLQPLSTLLKIEALIQKRDTESMELARQLLMDCEWGEYDIVYDLLVTRWMLLGSFEDRRRFLIEAASLPESARQRMTVWAQIRNGNKDAMTEVTLDAVTAKGQSEVCDMLFRASYYFNLGKYDATVHELLDTQQKLRALQATGKSEVESWLLGSAKRHLSSKIDDILRMVSQQPRKPIN